MASKIKRTKKQIEGIERLRRDSFLGFLDKKKEKEYVHKINPCVLCELCICAVCDPKKLYNGDQDTFCQMCLILGEQEERHNMLCHKYCIKYNITESDYKELANYLEDNDNLGDVDWYKYKRLDRMLQDMQRMNMLKNE
jgi:hypothetical protein